MKSTNELRVIVKLGGITPEQARDVRARAWRFVFDCYEQKKAAAADGGEEHAMKGVKDASRNSNFT